MVPLRVGFVFVGGIVLLCFARLGIAARYDVRPNATLTRQAVLVDPDLCRSAAAHRFDDSVPVVITTGRDQQPGIAEHDDNKNELVDDRYETGSLGSDDLCLGPVNGNPLLDQMYRQRLDDPSSMVLSHGQFVPIHADESPNPPAERYLTKPYGWLIVNESLSH